jgi:hypothetical protein
MNASTNSNNQAAFCILAPQASFCILCNGVSQKRPSVKLQLTDLAETEAA